jgi:hypothetical protein
VFHPVSGLIVVITVAMVGIIAMLPLVVFLLVNPELLAAT